MTYDSYSWEDAFAPHILARGFDYYCSEYVGEIARQGDVLSAKVIGTKLYSVTIQLRDEEPVKMACSCPYAAGGALCKHMAAVLYQWEEDRAGTAEEYEEDEEANTDPAVMVANADDKMVRDFLTTVLTENESYRSRFRLLFGGGLSEAELDRYKQRIDRIIKSYMGREQFITYDRAGDFEIAMESFLDEEIMAMVGNGCLEDAFELTRYIFWELTGLDIDDSGGETSMLAESCVKYWKMIAEAADEDLQTDMFDECVQMLEDGELDFYADYVDEFLMQAFHTPGLLERKLKYAAKMCELFANPEEEGRVSYTAEVWVGRCLELLAETGAPDDEIAALCRKYWRTETARQFRIDRCLDRGDYAKAEKVLLENLDLFETRSYSQRPYDRQLLDLYQKSGEQEKYAALLKKLVLTKRAGDMEMYRTLKAQCEPEEWKKICAELLDAPAWEHYRRLIYEQEGMKEKLLEMVCENGSLYMAEQYTDMLKADYPKELLDIYERELCAAAMRTASRSTYREWARTLQRMKQISGGKERVQKILRDWRLRYANRPAMMDELRRVCG